MNHSRTAIYARRVEMLVEPTDCFGFTVHSAYVVIMLVLCSVSRCHLLFQSDSDFSSVSLSWQFVYMLSIVFVGVSLFLVWRSRGHHIFTIMFYTDQKRISKISDHYLHNCVIFLSSKVV